MSVSFMRGRGVREASRRGFFLFSVESAEAVGALTIEYTCATLLSIILFCI